MYISCASEFLYVVGCNTWDTLFSRDLVTWYLKTSLFPPWRCSQASFKENITDCTSTVQSAQH